MGSETRLRLLPLLLLVALGLLASGLPVPVADLLSGVGSRPEPGYEDLTPLLPDGPITVESGVAGPTQVVLAGRSGRGNVYLSTFGGSTTSLTAEWTKLPVHYGVPSHLAWLGDSVLVAAPSAGDVPLLGAYEPMERRFRDLEGLLPPGTVGIEALVPGPESVLLSLQRDGHRLLALWTPGAGELALRKGGPLSQLARTGPGAWSNGSYFLAGTDSSGDATLLRYDPNGDEWEDLGSRLSPFWERIRTVVSVGSTVYLAGSLEQQGESIARLTAIDPEAGGEVPLALTALRNFEAVEFLHRHGEQLLLLLRADDTQSLGTYDPAAETIALHQEAVPPSLSVRLALPLPEGLLLVGAGESPMMGLLSPDEWRWEDRSSRVDGPLRTLRDGVSLSDGVLLLGSRAHSSALMRYDSNGTLEDWSGGLEGATFQPLEAVRLGERLLLTARAANGTILLDYEPGSARLHPLLPPYLSPLKASHALASNGSVALVAGQGTKGLVLLRIDEAGAVVDLSAEAALHLLEITDIAPGDEGFLLVGRDRVGPAMVKLEPSLGSWENLGRAIRRTYGSHALPAEAVSRGGHVLVRGTANDAAFLGQWDEDTGRIVDLTRTASAPGADITALGTVSDGFLVAVRNGDGPGLLRYNPPTEEWTDVSPSPTLRLDRVAWIREGPLGVLVAAETVDGDLHLGRIPPQTGIGLPWPDPRFLPSDGTAVPILGLLAAISAALGYAVGRRRSRPTPRPSAEEDLYWRASGEVEDF